MRLMSPLMNLRRYQRCLEFSSIKCVLSHMNVEQIYLASPIEKHALFR